MTRVQYCTVVPCDAFPADLVRIGNVPRGILFRLVYLLRRLLTLNVNRMDLTPQIIKEGKMNLARCVAKHYQSTDMRLSVEIA